MIEALKRMKTELDKRRGGIVEDVNLGAFFQEQPITINQKPFPYFVADNFFKDEAHKDLTAYFNEVLGRGLVEHEDSTRFKPFLYHKGEYAYDGYVYTPRPDEHPALELFYSAAWNQYFSTLFGQPTGMCTSVALHYHPPGNKTGYVHHDYAPKWFSELDKLGNGVFYRERRMGLKLFRQIRVITLIYYLNNDGWQEGDGGGTGVYAEKTGEPVAVVEPINNRLFGFNISPHSFHAFQQNKKPRSTIIQWFHMDPEWCEKKYGFAPEKSLV